MLLLLLLLLLSSLGIKISITLGADILPSRYEMNEIINKFALTGDKFTPEMHLRQAGSKCIASGPFTKNKERVEKVKETGDSRCIYQNELDKTCFHYEIA